MNRPIPSDPDFAQCADTIAKVSASMVAYAAREQSDAATAETAVRGSLMELEMALVQLTSAARLKMAELQASVDALQALEVFSDQLQGDVERALNVVRVVLTAPALSPALIERLNASTALRCLLTDLCVLDETIRQHVRTGLPPRD